MAHDISQVSSAIATWEKRAFPGRTVDVFDVEESESEYIANVMTDGEKMQKKSYPKKEIGDLIDLYNKS